jgi:hypothetical protein
MAMMRAGIVRAAHGTVMVETLIAFVPLFMLFLGVVQYTLLAAAQLVVRHAAVAGVRSASVVLDDDRARYDGAGELSISEGEATDATRDLAAVARLALTDVPDAPELPADVATDATQYGARMAPIRNAVYAKLGAIVPARAFASLEGKHGVSMLDGLGTAPALRLVQAARYLPVATAITFPRTPGDAELFDDKVEPAGLLTVRITHAATCTVPLVSAFMCRTLESLASSEQLGELQQAPAAQHQQHPDFARVRAIVVQGEASMPLQSAPYAYASEQRSDQAGSP